MRITTERKRIREGRNPIRPLPPTERGLRFYQLLALAEEGKRTAIADLFKEFGVQAHEGEAPDRIQEFRQTLLTAVPKAQQEGAGHR